MGSDYYKNILDAITDGVYAVDKDRKILYWNKAAEKLTGYTSAEVVGASCAENMLCHIDAKGRELCTNGCPLKPAINDGTPSELSGFFHHKSGYRAPAKIKVSPLTNDLGEVIGAVEHFFLATTRESLLIETEKIHVPNVTDDLTKINNSSLIELAQRASQPGFLYGLLFAEINNFEQINDLWGQAVSDNLIRMVGNSLNFGVRTFDSVSYWGGDRFLIACPYCNTEELNFLGEKLRMLVENSWLEHEGASIKVTASFGGATAKKNEEVHSVLQRANAQLHINTQDGVNVVNIDS